MPDENASEITVLLNRVRSGEQDAQEHLFKLVSLELRRTAAHLMMQERANHTLQPTALVNEAVMKLLEGQVLERADGRNYLFGAAVRAMRQILVDHARRKRSLKQGGDYERQPLDEAVEKFESEQGLDLEELDRVLGELDQESPRQREIVEHRFFGGLTVEQTAQMLDVSVGTVERDWRFARAWLYRLLNDR